MIIKNFSNPGTAQNAVTYLLNSKNRSVDPKILRGNAALTIELSNLSKHKEKITSGVIAFRDNENVTEEQKENIMNMFEKTFFGNMKDRTNVLFVEHREKGNIEIHYVINKIDLDTGKSLNHFHKSKNTIDLMKEFSAVINHKYGFEQITDKNPLETKYSDIEIKGIKSKSHNFKTLDSKRNIDKALQDLVKDGSIKNRIELIEFLKDNDKELSRIGKDYISIKIEDGRNIRLKGGIYDSHNDKNYIDVMKEFKEDKKEDKFNLQTSISNINRIVQFRNIFNSQRYQAEQTKPIFQKLARTSQNATGSHTAPSTTKHPEQPAKPVQSSPLDVSTTSSILSTSSKDKEDSQDHDSNGQNNSSSSMSSSVASAQMSLDRAISQLANAKTPAETAKAQAQVAIARSSLNKAVASAEEEKKKSHNKQKF